MYNSTPIIELLIELGEIRDNLETLYQMANAEYFGKENKSINYFTVRDLKTINKVLQGLVKYIEKGGVR